MGQFHLAAKALHAGTCLKLYYHRHFDSILLLITPSFKCKSVVTLDIIAPGDFVISFIPVVQAQIREKEKVRINLVKTLPDRMWTPGNFLELNLSLPDELR